MEKEKWSTYRIAKELGISIATVQSRFKSKYAKERWGVEIEERRDGSLFRYVSSEKIGLWKNSERFMGRPVFRKVSEVL